MVGGGALRRACYGGSKCVIYFYGCVCCLSVCVLNAQLLLFTFILMKYYYCDGDIQRLSNFLFT